MKARAIAMRARGGPEVLEPGTIDLDWPRPCHVLVRLRAASVNPADVYFRQAGPYVGAAEGCVLGHDGAGVVEAVGAGVLGFAPGEGVCFCHGGIGGQPGTYAEWAVVPDYALAKIPPGVGFEAAAALPLVFITGWEVLGERIALKAGERVLIHGPAGGTGHVALQIAKRRGARILASAGTEEKAALAQRLGAERTVCHREEDFVAAALDWTEGRGLEAAFDNIGGETASRTLKAMALYGRFGSIMGMPAETEESSGYVGNLTIVNVMMLTPMWRGLKARMAEQARMVERGLRWIGEGALKLEIAARYPLKAAADAHRRLEAGGTLGKIVLTMADERI